MAETLLEHRDEELRVLEASIVRHRVSGFFAILRSDDFVHLQAFVPVEEMPPEPDPLSQYNSKRRWEALVRCWRIALRAKCEEFE